MSRVLNGSLIVLKWQNIHMISNIKWRERERDRDRDRDREKERRNLTKQFTLHSAEVYSEPFTTSKQGGYVTGGSYFHKNIHLRCLKRF